MAKTHRIEGDLELLGIAYMGKSQSADTTRTIEVRGSETNISLALVPKGTGTIQVPASYEDNIASDQDLINRAYANARVAGIEAGALVTAPGAGQDGYALTYDHATTSYTLTAIATALTFEDGITESGGTVKLGGDIDDAETNITQTATGVTRLRTMYTTGTDEAGVAVEAVAQDNNQVTLYAVGGSIRLTHTEAIVTAPGTGALKYAADYSGDYTVRTMPDVDWVQNHIGGKDVDANILAPTASEHGYVIGWENGSATYKLIPFPAPSSGYTTVEEEGVAVTARTTINFVGSGVTAVDSSGKTVVTITGVSGLTANRIPYATSATALGDDSALTWDATNDALTINGSRIHTTGTNNNFIGNGAGNFTNTGNANVGIGTNSLDALTSGTNNVGVGQVSLSAVTDGDQNTGLGGESLQLLSTGNQNTGLGFGAGSNITTGSQNVIIGYNVNAQSISANGQLSIANAIFGTGNTATGISVSTGKIGMFVAAPTARLHLPAGTAAASTAPLKLTSGTALGTIENGALEYHSSHLYFSIGSTRYQLDQQGGGTIGGSTGVTDNRLIRSDGTGGSTIQNSVGTLDDSGNLTIGSNPGDHLIFQPDPGANAQATITSGHSIAIYSTGNSSIWVSNSSSGNVGFFALAANFQSMTGGMFIANRGAAPTGDPTGGGFLYVESGALKYRGSSGTVTTIANA